MESTRSRTTSKVRYWQHNIESWQKSGVSQKDYCCTHGLALATFSYWRRKLKDQSPAGQNRFYPLTIRKEREGESNTSGNDGNLVLQINGFRLEINKGFGAEHLRQVINALEQISR